MTNLNEVRNRILLSVAAYAYEYENESIMSDSSFDALCLKINTDVETGNKKLDTFFKTEFDPSTGQWIHKHPDLKGVKALYQRWYQGTYRD